MPRIQLRRDTSSNWSSTNPTLYAGEIGVETDTMSYKLGDGSTNWNSLAYTSLPDGVNDGDVLTWNSSTNSWQAEAPTGGGGSLPNGTSDGQVLTWDGTNSSWSAEAVPTELPSATDGQVLTWDGMNNSWGAESVPTELPSSATTGNVLTWTSNNAWEPQAPSGGSATLPNGTVNMEPLVYDAGNSSWYAAGATNSGGFLAYNQGSYGFNGIRSGPSDAQAGDILRYTGTYWEAQPFVPAGTNSTNGDILYWNSGAGTWSTGGLAPTTANILYYNSNNSWALGGLTSMNGAPNNGDVLTYDATNAIWIAAAAGAGLPNGTNDGEVLTWDGMNSSWTAEAVPAELPSSATTGQVLTWTSNNAWAPETPNAAGLPSASIHNQLLQYNSTTTSWEAGIALDGAGNNGDMLVWSSMDNKWAAMGLSGHAAGNIIFYNGYNWQMGGLTDGPSGTTPSDGEVLTWNSAGSYWEAAAPGGGGGASLPSGSGEHDILVWNTASSTWLSLGLSGISDGHMLHVGASGSNWVLGGKTSSGGNPFSNDFLYWNGNNWYATGFGVTSGNHALTYNGSNWEATATPASSNVVIVDVSSSTHTLSFVNGVLTSYSVT